MATPQMLTGRQDRDRIPRTESSTSRPIDLAHLARQTMGDRSLEQEVLKLFVKEAVAAQAEFKKVEMADRQRLAHRMKGSARSIGAFKLADSLARLERSPAKAEELRRVSALISDVCNFVAAISR